MEDYSKYDDAEAEEIRQIEAELLNRPKENVKSTTLVREYPEQKNKTIAYVLIVVLLLIIWFLFRTNA